MKVGIVSDGVYGDRAYENIRRVFDALWIEVEFPSTPIVDDMKLDVPFCDLYVSYVRHPDVALALIELGRPVILAISFGLGFLRQALEINEMVVAPETMCSLEDNTGIKEIDVFAKSFGRPEFKTNIIDGKFSRIEVLRGAPCGSTWIASSDIIGRRVCDETLRFFGLRVCHYCRAPRLGRTCDKEKAALIHVKQLLNSLEHENLEGLMNFDIKKLMEYKVNSTS